MRNHRTWIVLAVLAAGRPMCAAETALTRESPFLPAAGAGGAPAEPAALQLAGISVISPSVYVCLFDPATKRGRWLAVGAKADNLEVISCDVDRSEAVINDHGRLKTLPLRKSAVAANPGATPPAVASPPIPNIGPAGGALPEVKPLLTRESQEREARMLVSDLLEIGMRQRKAYEEAQKKAAEEAAKKGGAARAP